MWKGSVFYTTGKIVGKISNKISGWPCPISTVGQSEAFTFLTIDSWWKKHRRIHSLYKI